MERHNLRILPQELLFGGAGLMVVLLYWADMLASNSAFAILTGLLLSFLWLQVHAIRRIHPRRWLINPAIVCTFVTFVMGYGITNAIFLLPPDKIQQLGLEPDVFPAMVVHQWLALLGALALFLGYWSSWAGRLTEPFKVKRFQQRCLPETEILNRWAVPILLFVSVGARLVLLNDGLYGYGGDYGADRIQETGSYSQYLFVLGGVGKLALVLASFYNYSPEASRTNVLWFFIVFFVEVFFGFLSGMKSAVCMPFVIVGICYYLRRGRLPTKWILLASLAITVAYLVIEPFRAIRNQDGATLTSLAAVIDVLERSMDAPTVTADENPEEVSTTLSIMSRTNLSYIGAFGLDYADTHEEMPTGSPQFLDDILLAPIHALVPRFIWDSKPLGNLGLWYNQEVMGMTHFSSTAMGPFAYLYFAGGFLIVPIVFFLIGMTQRCLWFFLTPWSRISGAVVILALLNTVGNIDSAVNSIVINLIRDGLLSLLLVNLIFKNKTRVNASEI